MHMRNTIKMFGLGAALVLSACGGDKGDDLGRFIGTWQPTSGTLTAVCGGYTYTQAVNIDTIWRAGTSSDLITTDASGLCSLPADVNGYTAAASGKSCTGSDGSILTISSYTFVISPDGRTATENESGNAVYVVSGGTVPCTMSETASYQKISN
jgi:hypothetical protein